MFGEKWRRSHEGPDPPRVPGRTAALVVGALPAFAFPAPSWWWLAWFGLTPLLLVVRAAPTAREGGVRAWWGLAGYVRVTQYWLGRIHELVERRIIRGAGLRVGASAVGVVGPDDPRAPVEQSAQDGAAGDGGGVVAPPGPKGPNVSRTDHHRCGLDELIECVAKCLGGTGQGVGAGTGPAGVGIISTGDDGGVRR